MNIPEYTGYTYVDGKVFTPKGKQLTESSRNGNSYFKMQHDNGWRQVAKNKVLALCGIVLELPSDAKLVPNSDGTNYIDESGVMYSFGRSSPDGKIRSTTIGSSGYPAASLMYKGKTRTVTVHKLMLVTFVLEDYVERGLVCMHKDNDKTNSNLSNLCLGTYSQNNKDAYADGLNPGNGLRKN